MMSVSHLILLLLSCSDPYYQYLRKVLVDPLPIGSTLVASIRFIYLFFQSFLSVTIRPYLIHATPVRFWVGFEFLLVHG